MSMVDAASRQPAEHKAAEQKAVEHKAAQHKAAEHKPALVLSATVVERRRLSPSFARVTLAGEGLRHFAHKGYDQWFRLFLQSGKQGELQLPSEARDPRWYAEFRSAPAESRPTMRYATVREYRVRNEGVEPEFDVEIDVDVVIHGEHGVAHPGSAPGPLSTWAQTVEPGQRVALLDQGTIFRPQAVGADVLLIGDETAVPAIAGIASALAPEVRGRAFVEVPEAADIQQLAGPEGLEITWLPRNGAKAGGLALAATRGHLAAEGRPYLYAAGESTMIRTLNGLLRDEFDWPPERYTTVIYWHDSAAALT